MDCKWHPGQEPYLTCLQCGQKFCRECIRETNDTNHCPECHRAHVDRLASQMGARPAKEKAPREKPATRRAGKRSGKDKGLPPPLVQGEEAPPAVLAPPEGRDAATAAAPSAGPAPAAQKKEAVTPEWKDTPRSAPARQEFSPPAEEDSSWVVPAEPPNLGQTGPAPPSAPASEAGDGLKSGRRKGPKKLRRPADRTAGRRAEEPAPAEKPDPMMTEEEKAAFWDDASKPRRASRRSAAPPPDVGLPAAAAAAGEADSAAGTVLRDEYAPRLPGGAGGRRRRKKVQQVVALQLPDDYEGEVTSSPSYFKAVLFGLLAALLLAGAYAGFEWWRHSGRWIFGWVIGFVVGIVVVFGSGRHFNWKLGLISAFLAWFSLCLGQFAFGVLDATYPAILKGISIPFPTSTLLKESALALGRAFASPWVILFVITGMVAFLISFRPWPITFQTSGRPDATRAGSAVPPRA